VLQQSKREQPLKALKTEWQQGTGFDHATAHPGLNWRRLNKPSKSSAIERRSSRMKSEECQWLTLEARLGQLEAPLAGRFTSREENSRSPP
jgi:hypothetical protein